MKKIQLYLWQIFGIIYRRHFAFHNENVSKWTKDLFSRACKVKINKIEVWYVRQIGHLY